MTALATYVAPGIGGLFLPPRLIGYIGSFMKAQNNSDMLLNLYKAFAILDGPTDPLKYYKEEVLCYIAGPAMDGIYGKNDYGKYTLNHEEIMYIFDAFYGNSDALIYGDAYRLLENPGTLQLMEIVDEKKCQFIDDEFKHCSAITDNLGVSMHLGLSDDLDAMTYKFILLLEEALRTKSRDMLAYIKKIIGITADMLMYLYVKHTHQLYAPRTFCLATDDTLLELCWEAGILPQILQLAIGGKRHGVVYSEAGLSNIIQTNLAVVKKIVPAYIGFTEMMPYWNADGIYGNADIDMITPYSYWLMTYQTEVTIMNEFMALDFSIEERIITGNDAIGAYLTI